MDNIRIIYRIDDLIMGKTLRDLQVVMKKDWMWVVL